MIALDIETTGLSPTTNDMISLGGIHIETNKEFYDECRIYEDSVISETALSINGFTKEQIQDKSKIFPHELYLNFLNWANQFEDVLLIGQNLPSFDVQFLKHYHYIVLQNKEKWIFGHRYIDLHSYVFAKTGKSQSHDKTLKMLGLKEEEKPHNALNGARAVIEIYKNV